MINTSSARAAITLATGAGWQSPDLTVKVDKSDRDRSVPKILHGLDCGRILRAMDKTKEPHRSWLCVAYAATGWATDEHLSRVHEELVTEFHKRKQVRQPGKISIMALVCIGDMRNRLSGGASKLAPAAIARKVRFDVRNWDNGWVENYREMEAILDDWDRQGLAPIAADLPLYAREKITISRAS
jgi:hypothetical protein